MEIKVENGSSQEINSEQTPLLVNKNLELTEESQQKTLIQQAISQTFESTAHLANLLPTGSVLSFQLLAPIFTNQGQCDVISQTLTASLLALCGLSCIMLTFSDSYKDQKGNICYGFATPRGLWTIDGSCLEGEEAAKYRVRVMDFVHAVMSILVFAAVALFDENVVDCFYPAPSVEVKEVLTKVPVGIGVVCSFLFVVFPTKRHGIGFPVSKS